MADDFKVVDNYLYNAVLNETFSEGEFDHLIILLKDINEPINFRNDEVEQIKWIQMEEIENFIKNNFNEFVLNQKSFYDQNKSEENTKTREYWMDFNMNDNNNFILNNMKNSLQMVSEKVKNN